MKSSTFILGLSFGFCREHLKKQKKKHFKINPLILFFRHRTGVVETKLAVIQTRFIASLSHVQMPDIGVKLTFDSMDKYVEKLQQIIEESSADYRGLIAELKEALSDFKF